MIMEPLDPRWEWIPVHDFGKAEPSYIKGPCLHREIIPITTLDEETIAMHCLTCQRTFYRGSAA